MEPIKNILFPTDFSPCARFAAGNALAFARKYDADLFLLHASLLYENDPQKTDKLQDEQLEITPEPYVNRRMDDVLDVYNANTDNVHRVQIRGITEVASILEYAHNNPINLIIMGTHGRRGFKRWLLGSVAEEMVRMAPCPVITLKEHWNGNLGNLRKILVPIDFSETSRKALHYAQQLAARFNATLYLLHVIQEPFLQDLYGTTLPNTNDFQDETEQRAREIMKSMVQETEEDREVEMVVASGHPAREIIQFADTNGIDLIFMAHTGHTRLPDRILGSVTEHVVRTAHCPVFTAPMDG